MIYGSLVHSYSGPPFGYSVEGWAGASMQALSLSKLSIPIPYGYIRLYPPLNYRQKYLGRPEGLDLPETDTEHLHFPGLGEEAAKLLVHRGVIILFYRQGRFQKSG